MKDFSKTKFSKFGQTRLIPIITYTNGKKDKPARRPWEMVVYLEDEERLPALLNSVYKDKTILVVTRENFFSSEVVRDDK